MGPCGCQVPGKPKYVRERGDYLSPRQGTLAKRHSSPMSPLSPLGHSSPMSPLSPLSLCSKNLPEKSPCEGQEPATGRPPIITTCSPARPTDLPAAAKRRPRSAPRSNTPMTLRTCHRSLYGTGKTRLEVQEAHPRRPNRNTGHVGRHGTHLLHPRTSLLFSKVPLCGSSILSRDALYGFDSGNASD